MMTPADDVLQRIRQFITTTFYIGSAADFGDDTSLLEHGIVDSTGVLEIVGFLASAFHVKVSDEDLVPENLDSVARIAAYATRRSTES
jgi:acyl carrier protein